MTNMGMKAPFWLDPFDRAAFPDVELAMTDPNGLLAVGGDLSTERLLTAYRSGIFPWYSAGQPMMWWSPNPRAVLFLNSLRISRSLKKSIRNTNYELRLNTDFDRVLKNCATSRRDGLGTWITQEMASAYNRLHRSGHAHSIEVWQHNNLIGGLYGIGIGKIFFGESMFSRVRDASKIALTALVKHLQQHQFAFIDCQVESPHLATLGARAIPRTQFIKYLDIYCHRSEIGNVWNEFLCKDELVSLL